MALLAVDVTLHGLVMSADSQPVEIFGGENRVDASAEHRTRNPIFQRSAGGFVGLVGSVGTERIEGTSTTEWLRRFDRQTPNDDLATFCGGLAYALGEVWRRDGLTSILEILVTGEISGEPQFWFVRNSQGLRPDWRHADPADSFAAEDDLSNYVEKYRLSDKTELIQRISHSFRQGVLLPAAPVFDAFGQLLNALVEGQVEGFDPIKSLDDVGQFARVRMEFLKRLCSAKHGIYSKNAPSPISGEVHVYGVGLDGRVCEYLKHRSQVATLRQGRT